jgi:hypothetical protein
MYTYENSKEFLIMSVNTFNVFAIYPLLGFQITYIVICSRNGLKEPGAMGSGSVRHYYTFCVKNDISTDS